MRKIFTVLLGLLVFGVLVGTTYLVSNPVRVYASEVSADCADGTKVTCRAYRCMCTDGHGCTGWDLDGNVIFRGRCRFVAE
jgi:uncharacterized protein involved in propanediol utilization